MNPLHGMFFLVRVYVGILDLGRAWARRECRSMGNIRGKVFHHHETEKWSKVSQENSQGETTFHDLFVNRPAY